MRYRCLLQAAGYDEALQPVSAPHPYVVSVHTAGRVSLEPRAVDTAQVTPHTLPCLP